MFRASETLEQEFLTVGETGLNKIIHEYFNSKNILVSSVDYCQIAGSLDRRIIFGLKKVYENKVIFELQVAVTDCYKPVTDHWAITKDKDVVINIIDLAFKEELKKQKLQFINALYE